MKKGHNFCLGRTLCTQYLNCLTWTKPGLHDIYLLSVVAWRKQGVALHLSTAHAEGMGLRTHRAAFLSKTGKGGKHKLPTAWVGMTWH